MASDRPPRPGNGPDRVHEALRRAVLGRDLPPGRRLPEGALAATFGVSRTVVRAALDRLCGEGLATRAANRSARVAALDLGEAADLLDVRQGLEAMVVRRLAGRLDPAALASLRAHVAQEERASSLDRPEAVRLAGEFHVLLATLAESPLLTRYVTEVVSRSSLILTTHARAHSSSCAVREHEGLIALLAAGDAGRAEAAMRRHLDGVARRAALPVGPGG